MKKGKDGARVIDKDDIGTKYGGDLTIYEPWIIHIDRGVKESLGHYRDKDTAQEVLDQRLKETHFGASLKRDYNIQIINVK